MLRQLLLRSVVNVQLVRIGIRVVLPAGQIDGRMCAPLHYGRHDGAATVSWLRMRRGRGGIVMWLQVSLQRHRDGHGLLLLRAHGEVRRKRRLVSLLMLRQRLMLLMRLRQLSQHRLRKGQRLGLRQARVPRARLTGRRRDGARSDARLAAPGWVGRGCGWKAGGDGGRMRRRCQVHAGQGSRRLLMAGGTGAGARLGCQHGRSAAAEQSVGRAIKASNELNKLMRG